MNQALSSFTPRGTGRFARVVRAAMVRDVGLTFDSSVMTHDAMGNHRGRPLGRGIVTHDGRTVDSTGAFLVGELERLDQTLHMPLTAVTYPRDIDMREDVTIADEVSSFTLSTFASMGGLGAGNGIGTGKAWIGKSTNQITGIGLDIAKVPNNLNLWGMEVRYTIPELESAAKLGRPIDAQKYEGMKLKHQMDVDEQVYIGDTSLGTTGLVNNASVTAAALPNGVSGNVQWSTKVADEILNDFNLMLTTVWTNSNYALMPSRVLLPPVQYGYISTQKVSLAGNVSILKYILDNNIAARQEGAQLSIEPLKWLLGAGAGGTVGTAGTSGTGSTDRAVVYTKNKERVRYPMTLLQRTPLQYQSIYHLTTYFCRLGVVEVVYPQAMGYFDGL